MKPHSVAQGVPREPVETRGISIDDGQESFLKQLLRGFGNVQEVWLEEAYHRR